MKSLVSLEQRFDVAFSAIEGVTSLVLTKATYLLAAAFRVLKRRPGMERQFDPAAVHSILLTRLDGLGDLVLFSALVREIRSLWPHAHITLVVDDRFYSFVAECPYVDQVIGFDERGSKYARLLTGPWRAYRLAKRRLWCQKVDLAVSPRWDFDTRHAAVLGLLSLPRYHFGFSENVSRRKSALNRGLDSLFTHLVPSLPGARHEVERNGEVLAALGEKGAGSQRLELWLSKGDRVYAVETLAEHGVMHDEMLVCLGIGATMGKRRWPIERFAELGAWLTETYAARILVVGDSSDSHNAEYMRAVLGPAMINQAGLSSVRQSAALLSMCTAYIGNDSGPMHLAAASGVPVIELSCHPITAPIDHINSPYRYKPLSSGSHVIQPRPGAEECRMGCMDSEAHCILNLELSNIQQVVVGFVQERQHMQAQAAVAEVENVC